MMMYFSSFVAASYFQTSFALSLVPNLYQCPKRITSKFELNANRQEYDDVAVSDPLRRSFLSSTLPIGLAISLIGSETAPAVAIANEDAPVKVGDALLVGTITLQENTKPAMNSDTALYITVRPDKPDNVPSAILSGTRGKPPPILVARFANPQTFPFEFTLSKTDLTAEGRSSGDDYWWSSDNLIVSARLDMDGVAATRDPDDLVGRGSVVRRGNINGEGGQGGRVEVQLQGRGGFGKFATSKSK